MTRSPQPLQVLHVGKRYPPEPGGMERVVQQLCEGEGARCETRALVSNRSGSTVQDTVNGIGVTRVGSLGHIGSVGVCPTFPVWLRRLHGDVNVIHEPNPLAVCSYLVAQPRGRLVVWFHAEVVRPAWKYRLLYRRWHRRILNRADRVIVASPRVRDQARELAAVKSKCRVIPYGIDPNDFVCTRSIRQRLETIRARYGADPVVLFVGRLVPYKGVEVLIDALVKSDATAVLIGDGPLRTDLERRARSLGLGNRVVFRGEVDETELVAWYHRCDLLVLPSVTKAEAFGLVQIEAMACRKPVVSTDLPSGVPWVNRHGETGLVVPPGDVAALEHAITTVLADDRERRAMGERGRRRVDEEFTIDRMVRETTALYEELVSHGG